MGDMMARTNQTIQVTYWQRAKDRGLSPDEKLVELFLMTCPECGASGVFRMDVSSIAYELGHTEQKIKAILDKLKEKNRVYLFDGNWILVAGKFEYEPTKSEKILKCAANELSVSPNPVQMRFLSLYDSLFPTIKDSLSVNLSVTNTITDTISNTITDTNTQDSGKPEQSLDKLEKYKPFVIELFPDLKHPKHNNPVEAQAGVLEKIVRLDGCDPKELGTILRWGRQDEFWRRNFLSCSPLRDRKQPGDAMKWQKIKAAYEGERKSSGRAFLDE